MFICAFEFPPVGRLVCLIETGATAPVIDDRRENFFAGAFDFEWLNARIGPARALAEVVSARRPAVALVARNPDILYDRALLLRVLDVIPDCDRRFDADGWLIAAAEAADGRGEVSSALYSLDEPRFLTGRAPRPAAAIAADAYLVNLRPFAQQGLSIASGSDDLESTLIAQGYGAGLVSVFHPRFAIAVRQRLKSRLPAAGSLLSAQDSAFAIDFRNAVAGATKPMSMSIVVRTVFNRPHLLRRLLVSILRAEIEQVPIEVVIASDAPDAERHFAAVTQDHRRLKIRFAPTPPGDEPSRNRNLRAGVAAAKNDYIWIIDDDDYVDIFAFSHLKLSSFGDAAPLIFATADVHEETWTPRDGGSPVLSSTQRLRNYPASGWRDMFIGYNRIPICGCIAPREFLQDCLARVPLRHELSEDYALFLSVLSAPDLPEIIEIEHPLSHISQRAAHENTMQMEDRSPWARNIVSYLSDLSYEGPTPGVFQVFAAVSARSQPPAAAAAAPDDAQPQEPDA